jgi:DNA-binding transcriptional regulator YiaG
MEPKEITEYRKTVLKITQEELARRIDVSLMTVNRWEKGHSKPHRRFIKMIKALKP